MMLWGTAGMLRGHSLVAIKDTDAKLARVHTTLCVSLFIETAKNDQGRFGHTILLSQNEELYLCPVTWFKLLRKLRRKTATYLFHNSQNRKNSDSKSISPKGVTNHLKAGLRRIGLSQEEVLLFASHSLRRTGATRAAAAGIPRALIERQGHWAPGSTALTLYIDVTMENLLRASRAVLSADKNHGIVFL